MTTLGSFFDILETNMPAEPLTDSKLKFAESNLRQRILTLFRERYGNCPAPRFDLTIHAPISGAVSIILSRPPFQIQHAFTLVGCLDKTILGFELEHLIYDFFGFPKMTRETMIREIVHVANSLYGQGYRPLPNDLFERSVGHILDASLFYHREDKVTL